MVRRAIEANRPDAADGVDVLAKVGGFEIGVLAGVMLAAAAGRRPLIVDGFISGAAALVAVTIAPQAKRRLIASHQSVEPGHRIAMEYIELSATVRPGDAPRRRHWGRAGDAPH